MLELNKEYTYSQICEVVGWKPSGGNQKKAQIKEIEDCFEWYHPINKKTKKEKKSYIFTKQLREPVEPSKSNCGGSRNLKNIKPMMEYMQGLLSDDCFGNYISMTDWYTEILSLLDKELCKTVYCGEDAIDFYCDKNGIYSEKLLSDYVSTAKSVLKNMFIKALGYMEKKDMAVFNDGYIFIYQLGKRSIGYVATDCINDIIIANETEICNDLKEEHNLSDKLKGRQLLMQIYGRKELTEMFDELKLVALMDNDEALELLNKELEMQHEQYHKDCGSICADRPLIGYYRGVCIQDMELTNNFTAPIGKEICNIIRTKTRKTLFSKKYMSSWGEIIYPYSEYKNGSDIVKIEKLLFKYFDEDLIDTGITDEDMEELDALFQLSHYGNADDFSAEEILDMPTLSEVV